jgi:hypothetical protein
MKVKLRLLLEVVLRLRGGLELLIVFLNNTYNIIFYSVVGWFVGVVVCVGSSSISSSSVSSSSYLLVVVVVVDNNNNIYNVNVYVVFAVL